MLKGYKIIRKSEQKTTQWSGGTTTELFIYPQEASYVARNFNFRISTAKIETETSDFTQLPDTERVIISLDNNLWIRHEDQQKIELKPFEKHRFKGDWQTSSRGKVTDFNLMLKNGYQGDIETVFLSENGNMTISTDSFSFIGLYILKGSVFMNIGTNEILIYEYDFFIANKKTINKALEIRTKANSIFVLIFLKK